MRNFIYEMFGFYVKQTTWTLEDGLNEWQTTGKITSKEPDVLLGASEERRASHKLIRDSFPTSREECDAYTLAIIHWLADTCQSAATTTDGIPGTLLTEVLRVCAYSMRASQAIHMDRELPGIEIKRRRKQWFAAILAKNAALLASPQHISRFGSGDVRELTVAAIWRKSLEFDEDIIPSLFDRTCIQYSLFGHFLEIGLKASPFFRNTGYDATTDTLSEYQIPNL